VSGPPGSGKTTLVASYLDACRLPCLWYQVDEGDSDISTFFYYIGLAARKAAPLKRKPLPLLTPEYMLGISTFTLRYFENLFNRFKTPFVLVFDNYQQVPLESKFHEVVSHGLSIIPEKINVIVISRRDPSPQFVQLRASNKVSFLGWEEIKFTLNESRDMVCKKEHKTLTDEILVQLHKKTEGWAAGLVLMMEMAKRETIDYQLLNKITPKEIFDYFASELFDKMDVDTQDFFLKTAFLPRMTAEMAEKHTGIIKAGQILSDLHQNHFFTERISHTEPLYQYHPLFRDFLLSRAKDSFDHNNVSLKQRNAAVLLEEYGKLEDSAILYSDAKDWEGLIRLILNNAQSLMSQGRIETLKEWIMNIPREILDRTPWLLYWLGVCQMPFNPAESRKHFEKSFQLFNEQDDTVGILLSWAAVVDSVLFEWDDFTILDPWIEWLDHRMRLDPSFPSTEVEAYVVSSMAGALGWRRPQHPDTKKWVKRSLSLSMQIADINLCVRTFTHAIIYYCWIGDFTNCSIMVEEMKRKINPSSASPPILLAWKFAEAIMYGISASTHAKSIQAVSEGIEIAQQSGVHIMDNILFGHGVYGSFYIGDTLRAGEFLKKVELTLDSNRRNIVAQYHFLAAWYYLLTENISHASVHAEKAVSLVAETGTPVPEIMCRLVMALILYATKKLPQALTQLSLAHDLARKIGSHLLEYISLLTEAQFAMDKDDEAKCLESLRKAMAIGRQQGYFTTVFFWLPSVMARLCAKAIENEIEVDYVQELIRKLNLFDHAPEVEIESWPYPLKIYTLGRFSLMKDGNPLKFSGKVQQKPFSLIKAILSFGGREVSENELSDSLWPEAAGDVAHISFKTNLHRLRQLIGHEEVIQLKEGRITLDQRYAWVDEWAFQRTVGKAEKIYKRLEDGKSKKEGRDEFEREFVQLSENAVNLYKGDFLAADSMEPWTVTMREKLKSKFTQLILKLCRHYEHTGQWEKAIAYCQRGLETDDLSEEFYQKLMICYQKLGRNVDAISVYHRCCKTLAAVMGEEPSLETVTIYKNIKTKSSNESPRIVRDHLIGG
jgi:LuxR family maltose regulon positive regulatory protein